MNTKNESQTSPAEEEKKDRWGTLVVIAFLVIPPVIGILYSIFG